MRIVSAYRKTFLDSDTVLGIFVTYENNTTEWLTKEEYDAIKQKGDRKTEEQAAEQAFCEWASPGA